MTSYTKIGDDERPSISIDPSLTIAKIEDNVYGGFTEHMGRCIYGGLYDPGNPLSDEHGFRKDVIEAMKELRVPVVRYPGGNFCATYHWIDGVGPRENRPGRPELAWIGTESNAIGTDEFLKWCEIVGTEPYLCLNFGTVIFHGPHEASDAGRACVDKQMCVVALGWLEYCNSDRNSYYANLRRKNGREKPYKASSPIFFTYILVPHCNVILTSTTSQVKYWALGNEVWGPWQVEQMTKEDYAKKAYQWAKALKLLDPSIELILCGETGYSTWDAYVLKECVRFDLHGLGGSTTASLIDMHSIHIYTASSEHLKNVTAPRSAERAIQISASLIDLARIENNVPPTVRKQKICFDEWNVWDPVRAPGEEGAEEKYNLSDALAVAVWLNVFIRQAEYVGMANIAQSVNVISPLMTTPEGLVKQTTWWPLLLYSKYMRGSSVAVGLRAGEYTGDTHPAWLRSAVNTPWLDVSAALSDDGWINLAVVNIHEEKDFETEIRGAVSQVEVHSVSGSALDVVNTAEKQEVGITESKWDGKGAFTFPKRSLTILRWKAQN
ncbi:unnamed protein product [Clonostachys rhizophaga]|uniref:non-reducing end alpha-L-arabinofuranosidase n=1 Tax=Clonostachys rhizophaga TaxID=160324 RepID=A0A9N9VIN8_9HYPO|nr:unnamed protein product [Clonostachys rhizophaga]